MMNSVQVRKFNSNLFSPIYVFLIVIWVIAGLILKAPTGRELPFLERVVILACPAGFSLLTILINPSEAYSFWTLGLTFLVTQTGFQAIVGAVTTSALEVALVVLLLGLVWFRRRFSPAIQFNIPIQTIWFAFVIFVSVILIFGIVRGDSVSNALQEYKGFVLYPFMAYVFIVGLNSKKLLQWSVGLTMSWYCFIAGRGLLEFIQGQSSVPLTDTVFRSSADYAPINIFGITTVAMSILVLGMSIGARDRRLRFVGFVAVAWLLAGAMTSVARTVLIAFAVGVIFLLISTRARRGYLFGSIFVGAVMLSFMPVNVVQRFFQASDSSTMERAFYLSSALQALKVYWPVGGGWGNGFFYSVGIGLYPSGGIPWYHNDYLNLAVQVGAFGLILYLGFWYQIIRAGQKWLKENLQNEMTPYVLGGLAALVTLLTGALFDHVLWRPDSGGMVGWTLGITLAAIHLHRQNLSRDESQNPVS